MNHPVLRAYQDLKADRTTFLLHESWDQHFGQDRPGYPVHFAGMAVFAANGSGTMASTLCVDQSADGTIWAPVLFSTPTAANQLAITIQPQAYVAILFVCPAQYVQIRLTAVNPDGVYVYMVQYPPISRPGVEEEY